MDIAGIEWKTHPTHPVNEVPSIFEIPSVEPINILSRIGSQSMNGRVYEVDTVDGYRVALKIMSKENLHECILASKLGDSNPKHFPKVISWNHNQPVIIRDSENPINDTFLSHIENQFVKDLIVDKYSGTSLEKKRLALKLKRLNVKRDELFGECLNMGVHDDIVTLAKEHHGVYMTLMASELLSGDLITFLKENPLHMDTPRIIREVFSCIMELVRHKVVHEDLHCGNILLRSDSDGNLSSVIHDFGESTEERSPYEHIRDIVKFLGALAGFVSKELESAIVKSRIMIDELQCSKMSHEIKTGDIIGLIENIQCGFK